MNHQMNAEKIFSILHRLKERNSRLTVNAVSVESLFVKGGTVTDEEQIKKCIIDFKNPHTQGATAIGVLNDENEKK